MADDIASLKIEVTADGIAKVTSGLDQLEKSSKSVQDQAKQTTKTFLGLNTTMGKTAIALAKLAGFSTVGAVLAGATKQAMAFNSAMAEVSTLTNDMDMDGLKQSVMDLTAEFGADKVTSAKALYQVISAGASTAAEAMGTLEAANKLAVGGVTDVATAADGLTSALNAYGLDAAEATNISDAMFVAMKAGKTTIEELSQNIGKVAPIAAQAGVSFDELLAATAAVTKTGLDTSMTMNSIRQVISNVIKPTKQAADAAEALGIDFSVAALEAKGFTGFLADVVEKTGSSTEALSMLFGSVESLQSILFLASQSGGTEFASILEQMAEKAGATQEAFDKMSETTGFMVGVLREQLKNEIIELGNVVLTYLNPALKFVTLNFEELKGVAADLGKLLVAGVVGKAIMSAPAVFMALARSVGVATIAMKGFTTAVLMNPFGIIAKGMVAAAGAIIVFQEKTVTFGETTATVGEWVVATWKFIKDELETVIDAIAVTWTSIFDGAREYLNSITGEINRTGEEWINEFKYIAVAIGNSIIAGFNFVGKAIGISIAAMIHAFKNFGSAVLKIMSSTWESIQAVFRGDFDFSELRETLQNELIQPAGDLKAAYKEAWEEATGTDYIGAVVTNMDRTARSIAENVNRAHELDRILPEIEVTHKKIAPAMIQVADAGRDVSDILENIGKDAKKAKEELTPFEKALVHTVERIDEVGSSFWNDLFSGALESASDVFDKIKDIFIQTLAEMAHLAVTRPIIMNVMGAMGFMPQGSGIATSSGMFGGGGGISSISSMLGGGLTTLGTGLYDMIGQGALTLGGLGIPGMDRLARASMLKSMSVTPMSMAMDIGGGLLGGWASNQVFGETSGIGNLLGGIAGSFIPVPFLGTAIGSFLGGGIESLFGSDKEPNRGGRVEIDLATGELTRRGRDPSDPKFSQQNYDAVTQAAEAFAAFSEIVGGSTAQFNIAVGDRRGIRLNGEKFNTMEDMLVAGFEDIIRAAENLDPVLGELVKRFDGTAEQTLEFATAMAGLVQMIDENPVSRAIEDYEKAMSDAGKTVTQLYREQVFEVGMLSYNFDGSAAAASELAQKLQLTQQMAYELSTALLTVGETIKELTRQQITDYTEYGMTDSEIMMRRVEQKAFLEEGLLTMTDPAQIEKTVRALLDINRFMFESLPEEERIARRDEFAMEAQELQDYGLLAVENGLTDIESTQTILQERLGEMLSEHAKDQKQAARLQKEAAATNQQNALDLQQIIIALQENGIKVTVDPQTGFVTGGEVV